ncbi:MAG: Polymer biosynthesis protein WecB/TagA/CpsF family [Verrucomicrobiales bacterium]|nr:Polymer biosynthesis protein WecB/TagA/CpsF family [Verrucomicrobiales bacterium]
MKLLVFYPYVPYPLNRGAHYRLYHLLKGLARDHAVDLIALSENFEGYNHKDIFEEFCGRVHFVAFNHPAWEKFFPRRILNALPSTIAHWTIPAVERALDEMLSTGNYDAVHICDIVLAQYFLKKNRRWPLIVDRTRVDLQYQLMEQKRMKFSLKSRALNLENLAKLWNYERAVAQASRFQVVCGPDDESFTRKYISKQVPVSVIPNGVDLSYFNPESSTEARDAHPTVVFCGAMDYNPNVDALRWYFSEIHGLVKARIPELRVLIVGKDPIPEVKAYGIKAGVEVTGGVPDVRPYYRRAWVQIVPIRIGGGTRLKIVESLGMKTAVVSTTIGAQGLGLRHGIDILLGDTVKDFADQVIIALGDPALRLKLEEQGIESARTRLSWVGLGQQLSDLYTRERLGLPANPSKTMPEPELVSGP